MVIHGTTDNTSTTANTPAILVDSTGRVAVAGPTGTSANQVQGTAADGAAVSGNPVRIAGKDGSGNTQDLITDTTGNLGVGTGTAGTAAANVVTVQGIASATPVIIGGAVAAGATDSGNPVKVGGVYNTTQPTYTNGQRGDLQLSARGSAVTSQYSPSDNSFVRHLSTNVDGVSAGGAGEAMRAASFGYLWNGATFDRASKASSTSRLLSSAATTNATSVKASAGNLFKITCENTVASKRYLKLYNKASAPTVGTDTPIWTEVIPASVTSYELDFGAQPLYFSTGIAYAITGAAADADTTALSAGDIQCLNIAYS